MEDEHETTETEVEVTQEAIDEQTLNELGISKQDKMANDAFFTKFMLFGGLAILAASPLTLLTKYAWLYNFALTGSVIWYVTGIYFALMYYLQYGSK